LAGALLLGAGWSALVNVGNVLTPVAFAGERGDTTLATNLANVFFGAGAFLTPLGWALLVRRMSFAAALALLAVLASVPGLMALAADVDGISAAATESREASSAAEQVADGRPEGRGPPANPAWLAIGLCGLALFCYFPIEASMAGWTTSLLIARGFGEAAAARVFSGFWLSYLAARLLTALAAGRGYLPAGSEFPLIVALSAASALALTAVSLARGRVAGALAVMAAGVFLGPLFPTIMAVMLDHTPSTMHGRAVGIAIALGGLGSSTMPLAIGACARRVGLGRAFLITVGLAAGLLLVGLLLMRQVG
jgi:fucose permease